MSSNPTCVLNEAPLIRNYQLVVLWCSGPTGGIMTQGLSGNTTRITIKAPLKRKATGNHLMIPIPLEKLRALSLVSAILKIAYAALLYHYRVFLHDDNMYYYCICLH